MRRIRWSELGPTAREEALSRPGLGGREKRRQAVARIFEQVAADGDFALRALTRRFDRAELRDLAVAPSEFEHAESAVPAKLKAALAEAQCRLDAWHRAGAARDFELETAPGVSCGRIHRAIGRVGLYVPAGTAPLPSTALMLGVPARIAGCREVVLCTPPRGDGSADPSVLVAAAMCGITRVFKVGGAQAIAAMALGTDSIPRCDKLFGPGNAWVTEAKRQVAAAFGGPAIDMLAGPSELMVIADSGAPAGFVAADLLSQAEHGVDSQVTLLTDSSLLLDEIGIELERQLAGLPRASIASLALESARLVEVGSLAEAIGIANEYAPEHLVLSVREPREWLARVQAAGSVFLGDYAPESLGDYCSGTNHVLPTGGAARAWSGLGVDSFRTSISFQEVSRAGLAGIGACAIEMARAEGLEAHARAVVLRLGEAIA